MAFSVRALSTTGIISFGIAGFNLATGVLIARILGPVGRGELLSSMVYPSLVAALGVAFTQPIIARRSALVDRPEEARALAGDSLGSAIIISPVLVLVAVFCIYAFSSPDFKPEIDREYSYAVMWIPLNVLCLHLLAIDWGRRNWLRFNFFRSIIYPAILFGICLLWLGQLGNVRNVLIVYVLANLLVAVIMLCLIEARPTLPSMHSMKVLLIKGASFGLARGSEVLMSNMDQIIATQGLAAFDRGQYAVSLRVISSLMLIAGTAGFVAFADGANRSERNYSQFLQRHRIIVLLLVVTCGAMTPLAWYGIPVVFGKSFLEARMITIVMVIGGLFMALSNILEQRLEGEGKPSIPMVGRILGAIGICFPFFVLKNFSLSWLAISFNIGFLLRYMWCVSALTYQGKLRLNELLIIRHSDLRYIRDLLSSKWRMKGNSEKDGKNTT